MITSRSRHVLDIKPDGWELLLPVLIAPGWGETPRVLGVFAHILALISGRRVICVGFPRWGRLKHPRIPSIPLETQRQAHFLSKVLDELGISRAHLVTHSASGLAGPVAAFLRLLQFASAQLLAPAGFLPGDTLPRVIARVLLKNLHNVLWAVRTLSPTIMLRTFTAILVGMAYFAANPVRALREAYTAAHEPILDTLEVISNEGVLVRLVLSFNDLVFPFMRLEIADLDAILVPNALHDAVYLTPEKIARKVADFLCD